MTPPPPTPPRRLALYGAAIAALAGAIGFGVAQLASDRQPLAAASGDRKVLYWYDPMKPDQHFDKPGTSPFMDMDLVPKYADAASAVAGGPPTVSIDPRMAQNLGVRFATVERGELQHELSAFGVVAYNERDIAVVQPRSAGFVQRVYRRAPGDMIARGAPLADILMPEWGGAQTEFVALVGVGDPDLTAAGRRRLQLLGMSPDLIAQVERTRRPITVVTLSSPIAGFIDTLDVRQGMTVSTGQTLARIVGLSTVWLDVAVPEVQAAAARLGQPVQAKLTAYPDEVFTGRVSAVLPQTQAESRSVRVRVELANRGGRLRPGMYAEVALATNAGRPGLLVPSEALVRTGRRNIVFLALDKGRFRPVEVQVGAEANGKTEIRSGLSEGDRVVASGQFLIDSEASLQNVLPAMAANAGSTPNAGAQAAQRPASARHSAAGRIEEIAGGKLTISHGPVPTLQWPAMTMGFALADPKLAAGLKVGQPVRFSFTQRGAEHVIHEISPAEAQP